MKLSLALMLRLAAPALAFLGTCSSIPAWASPITILPDSVANIWDHRGVNDIGAGVGHINAFGAVIAPAANSTITAVQDNFTVGPRMCAPTSSSPDSCLTATSLDSSRLGSWLLTYRNGDDVVSVATPTLAGAEFVPFATSVSLTGGGPTPAFRFAVPQGFVPDAIRINIFDKSVDLPGPFGGKDMIHGVPILSTARSYSTPAVLSSGQTLQPGKPYVLAINLIKLRPQFTEADFALSNRTAMILSRSQSFFEFTLLPSTTQQEVFLPSVYPDENPDDDRGGVHQFAIDEVGPDRTIFIESAVAVGYDYVTGSGNGAFNPNFASVLLPDVGGGQFVVAFANTTANVAVGERFTFPPLGVSSFSVRRVPESAASGPANVTAVVTGLTFVQSGQFTGITTPVHVAALPTLAAAFLPGSRAVQVGTTATTFATIVTSGPATATSCVIAPTNAPAGTEFSFQQTNAANVPVGLPNTVATIPGDSAQAFVISLTPSSPFQTTDITFIFDCANTDPVAVLPGVNTLLLTATSDPGPDIVALGATPTNDGIANIPGAAGTGVFSVATVNVGAGALITASVDTGSAVLPVVLTLCQTDPATAVCINPATPAASATVQIEAGQTPTFAVFVRGTGNVAFDPGVNRVVVRFKTPGEATVGATSVAVRTQ